MHEKSKQSLVLCTTYHRPRELGKEKIKYIYISKNNIPPVQSVANKSCNEKFPSCMICLELCVAEYLVQATRRVGQEVKSDDPEAKGDVEDGLQGDDLGDDHPGVPHCVPKLSSHSEISLTSLSS